MQFHCDAQAPIILLFCLTKKLLKKLFVALQNDKKNEICFYASLCVYLRAGIRGAV